MADFIYASLDKTTAMTMLVPGLWFARELKPSSVQIYCNGVKLGKKSTIAATVNLSRDVKVLVILAQFLTFSTMMTIPKIINSLQKWLF